MKVDLKHSRLYDPLNYYTTEEAWNDLLKYDLAFVSRKYGKGTVLFPKLVTKKKGAYSQGPTIGRWGSYGFKLTEVPDARKDEILFDFASQTKDWFTYRRIRKDGKDIWMPVSLWEFLQVDDTYELDCRIEKSLRDSERPSI